MSVELKKIEAITVNKAVILKDYQNRKLDFDKESTAHSNAFGENETCTDHFHHILCLNDLIDCGCCSLDLALRLQPELEADNAGM